MAFIADISARLPSSSVNGFFEAIRISPAVHPATDTQSPDKV
jgi:hypothetical protein